MNHLRLQPGDAIAVLRCIFDQYAGKEGDAKTLTKKEITTLLKEQLKGPGNQAEIDEFFKMLDDDGDGVVDFNEYIVLVASLAMINKDARENLHIEAFYSLSENVYEDK
uniref:Protein S100 n=1 Tax=Oryzias melastigma TaxID=30732 RepID=A0A3B3BGY8_ORYME